MNREDKNKKLCMFMGGSLLTTYLNENKELDHYLMDYGLSNKKRWPNHSRYHATSTMKYDKSWDWLMPVLKEMDLSDELKEAVLNQDIQKAYDLCVEQLN